MLLLVLGLILWFAFHLPKPLDLPQRRALIDRHGAVAVKVVAGLGLVAAVALMIIGYQSADFINLWYPPDFLRHLNNLLMLVAFVVYAGGGFAGWVRSKIRHPQLIATKIWAVSHLLVNGDLASTVLFGGLLAWAVLTVILINKRDGKGPLPANEGVVPNLMNLGAGLVAFVVVALVHNWAGVYPFG